MELANNQRVFFDESAHLYLLDGEKLLTGVTELMKKHSLGADYSTIPAATLKKAAEEGTAIHKEIEDYDNGLSVLRTPLIEEYVATCQEYGLKFARNEYLVSDNELIASSIDVVYEAEIGIVIVDIKTTTKPHIRPLQWQLGIYKVLFEKQTGLKVAKCYCLHIDRKEKKVNGLIPIEPVTEAEVDELLSCERNGQIFLDCHEEPSAEIVLTDEELTAYVTQQNEISRLKEQIKSIEETLKKLDARVLEYMLANNLTELQGGGGTFKVKAGYTRTTIDTERFRKLQPGLFDQYSKTSQVAPSLSFKVNK